MVAFENKGAMAATVVVAASDSLNKAAANYVCDGVADNVVIQEALNAGAGGNILLLEGNYITSQNLTVPDDTMLYGCGFGTIITPTGASIGGGQNGAIQLGNRSILRDMKVILAAGAGGDGTRPNVVMADTKNNVVIEKCWIVGDKSVADDGNEVRQNGVLFDSTTNSRIENCYIDDCKKQDILLYVGCNFNTITGNKTQGSDSSCIYLRSSSNNTIIGNTCQNSGARGIYLYSSSKNNNVIGNICEGNNSQGIYIYRSSYNILLANNLYNNGDTGIYISGDATTNSNYNEISNNECYGNTGYGLRIAGGTNANYNTLKANIVSGNTAGGIDDAGTYTITDQSFHSIALDLSAAAVDIVVFHTTCPCELIGYTILYTEASSADAGVNIRIGRYQNGVALDDDYFDVSVSEISKNLGYSKNFVSADLTNSIIAAGDTVTVGTAGGKTGTGEVMIILHIAEMVD